MEGDPKFEASQELPDFPYARYAELLGLRGHPRRRPRAASARRWDEALAADRPVRARGDHRPGRAAAAAAHHARAGARRSRSALAHGDPSAAEIVKQAAQGQARRVPARPMSRDAPRSAADVAGRAARRSRAYTIPTDAPEADGTLRLGRDDDRRRARRRAAASAGSATPTPTARPRALIDEHARRRRCAARDALAPQRRVVGDGPRGPQPRPPGRRVDGDRARSTSRCGTSRRGCSTLPLATLLGAVRDAVPVYGSGGFTSYAIERLQQQLGRLGRRPGSRA